MLQITKESLLALDNAAILAQASAAGMTVTQEDLLVNYAEIDHELTTREDLMVEKTKGRLQDAAEKWLQEISTPADLDPDTLDLETIFHEEIMDHIHSVWSYGSGEAKRELDQMLQAQNGDLDFLQVFARGPGPDVGGGQISTDDDLWNDAYEWYDTYSQDLAATAKEDLFIKVQPLILEALDQGIVRTALVSMILDQFARIGQVRADIIARTEANKAYNWGRRYRFDGSEALAGYRYSAIMDRRTTEICKALHGASWEKGDPNLDNYTPPNHFRCRSIIVPIHKYKDWTFKDPDLSGLSQRDQDMLTKFSDSSFYPKKEMAKAAKKKAKKKAAPRKKKAAGPDLTARNKAENEIRALSKETGIIFDVMGREIWRQKGGKDYVDVSDAARKGLLKGNVMTHNHPSGYNAFSPEDIFVLVKGDMAEMRAVTTLYDHSIVMTDALLKIPESVRLQAVKVRVNEINDAVKKEIYKKLNAGEITSTWANQNHWHTVWERVVKETGWFKYVRKEI